MFRYIAGRKQQLKQSIMKAKELQQYIIEKLNKVWTLQECESAIDLAKRRGATTIAQIRKEAINFLYS